MRDLYEVKISRRDTSDGDSEISLRAMCSDVDKGAAAAAEFGNPTRRELLAATAYFCGVFARVAAVAGGLDSMSCISDECRLPLPGTPTSVDVDTFESHLDGGWARMTLCVPQNDAKKWLAWTKACYARVEAIFPGAPWDDEAWLDRPITGRASDDWPDS